MAVRSFTRCESFTYFFILITGNVAVYPNGCSLSLVAMGSRAEYDSRVCFWDNVYGEWMSASGGAQAIFCLVIGYKMTAMKEEVFSEAHVHNVDSCNIISTSDVVKVSGVTVWGRSEITVALCGVHIHVPLLCS